MTLGIGAGPRNLTRHLPRCDGWIIERQIPSTPYRDAIGTYPLFSCRDWSQLEYDLKDLGTELVSLMLVPAPLDRYDRELLDRCFDRVINFKCHYVADLSQPVENFVKKSHRDTVGRARKKVTVHLCPQPGERLEQWIELFSGMETSSAEVPRWVTFPGRDWKEISVQEAGLDPQAFRAWAQGQRPVFGKAYGGQRPVSGGVVLARDGYVFYTRGTPDFKYQTLPWASYSREWHCSLRSMRD